VSVLPALVGSLVTVTDPGSVTVAVTRPAGAEVGDYVLLIVRNQTANDPLTAEGFDAIGPTWDRPLVTGRRRNRIFGRLITDLDTEPSSYTVTCPAGGRTCVVAVLARNVDPVTPVVGFGEPYGGNTVAVGLDPETGIEISAMELDGLPALGVAMFASEFTAGNDHVPATTPVNWSPLADVVAYPVGGSDNTVSRTFLSSWTRELSVTPSMPAAMTWGAPSAPGAEVIALLGTGGPVGEVPTVAEAIAYLGPDSSATEDQVTSAYATELSQQRRTLKSKYVGVDVGTWPEDVKEALFARIARRLELRRLPLGVQPTMTEAGPSTIQVGGYDREISRLERPYRRRGVG
jgi:hypothetical protein